MSRAPAKAMKVDKNGKLQGNRKSPSEGVKQTHNANLEFSWELGKPYFIVSSMWKYFQKGRNTQLREGSDTQIHCCVVRFHK